MTAPALRRLLVLCFSASGAAALIYQVAWVRLLTLALGHTVAAASTVLAAFMGGLALGAWIAGQRGARYASPLALYAGLEIIIAAIAIALPHILAAFDPVLVSAYADGNAPASFAIARVTVSLALIGVPAAAMGATYPLAVAWMTSLEHDRPTAADAGTLYAANSAGAAVGAVAAGFWLIEALGVRGTTWVAVALNLAAASLAVWLVRVGRQPSAARPVPRGRRRVAGAAPPTGHPRHVLAAVAAMLSGFSALVYEVAWTRLLALALGPTTYAFAAMAASFIIGIALGSSLGVRFGRRSDRALWLGGTLVATGASTVLAASFTASRLPLLIARDVATSTNFESLFVRQALTIVLVLLPGSVCLGATFSLALAVASPGPDGTARETAYVYVANTIGAVAGALTAGFVLVPRFGLQTTFLLASGVPLATGIAVAARAHVGPPQGRHSDSRSAGFQASRRALAMLATVALAAVAFGTSDWDRDLITSGAYKYARQTPIEDLEWSLRAGQLEYYREGAAGTVSVRRLAGARALAIDGKVDASNGGDMLNQRLLGLLPTLLHPEPRDALVIGLGSGVTADAVLASNEVRRLDIVEISPEVVEASAYFTRENHDVLRKPGVRLVIGDGRSHLRLSAQQYDVIISEPSNPWMSGVAALFTREFFEAARARLRPAGIFCQWTHTYEIAETDLTSIVHTFASVFPHGTMWLAGEGDLLLIGSKAPDVDARVTAIADRARLGDVPGLLASLGMPATAAPFVLLSLYVGGPQEMAHVGSGAAVQTDDRMALEFTAARAMYAPPPGHAARLRAIAANASLPGVANAIVRTGRAADWTARGEVALRAEAFAMAHESFRRAAAIDTRSARALRGAVDAAAGLQRIEEELDWLKRLAANEPRNAPVRVELSHVLAMLGQPKEAIAAAMEAKQLDPASAEALAQLASIFADAGDAARLTPIADELIQRFPAREDGHYYQATALFLERRAAEAAGALDVLMKMNPGHAKGHNLRGVVCAALDNAECARAAFSESARLNPRDPSAYVNLGYFHLERGDPAMAAEFFSEALAVDATATAARQGLTNARAAQEH